jgi:choline dehydrogenase-like flavoprotein
MNPEQDVTAQMKCEYLVIGSGAGGSVVARELARAGKEVLIAEEGNYFKTEDFNDSTANQLMKLYRSGGVTPIIGKPIVGFAEGACVGGSTVINAGYFSRTPQRILDHWNKDLNIRSYTMEDLIPHFENVERDLSVSIKKDDGSNKDFGGHGGRMPQAGLAHRTGSAGHQELLEPEPLPHRMSHGSQKEHADHLFAASI